jgi:hypothetical protein
VPGHPVVQRRLVFERWLGLLRHLRRAGRALGAARPGQRGGDRGEGQDGQHARADDGRGVGRQHLAVPQPDLGERDEQRKRGRGDEGHLDPLPRRQHLAVDQHRRQAPDDQQ